MNVRREPDPRPALRPKIRPRGRHRRWCASARTWVAPLAPLAVLAAGCAPAVPPAKPAAAIEAARAPGLDDPQYVPSVLSWCPVPDGWRAEPLKANARHTHQVWLSPSGKTAYGVIHFDLPWPVGPDLTLAGFLSAMRKSEGQAMLVEQRRDPSLPGIRFIADGGRYRIRAELIVRGWEAWTVYAGTLREQPAVENELALAERAVHHTRVGPAARQPEAHVAAE